MSTSAAPPPTAGAAWQPVRSRASGPVCEAKELPLPMLSEMPRVLAFLDSVFYLLSSPSSWGTTAPKEPKRRAPPTPPQDPRLLRTSPEIHSPTVEVRVPAAG